MQLPLAFGCIRSALRVTLALVVLGAPARAEQHSVNVPNFWNPAARPEKPDLSRLGAVRFLSDDDSPPFTRSGPDGLPGGFAIELARALCVTLKLSCSVQVLRFDTLLDTLEKGRGDDVVIAPLAVTSDLRRRFGVSGRYFSFPARFAARKGEMPAAATAAGLSDKLVGVVAETRHAAFLRTFFAAVRTQTFATEGELRQALKDKSVDLAFGDGVTLAEWLNSPAAENCCTFAGGAFSESHYFGEGLALIVRKGNEPLRLALDYGLSQLWQSGRYSEIYLKHFPLPPH